MIIACKTCIFVLQYSSIQPTPPVVTTTTTTTKIILYTFYRADAGLAANDVRLDIFFSKINFLIIQYI